ASYNTLTYIGAYSPGGPPKTSRTLKVLEQGDDGFYRVEKRIAPTSFKDATIGLLDVFGLAATFYGGPGNLFTKPTGGGTQAPQTIKSLIKSPNGIVGANTYGKCTEYAEGFVKAFQKSVSDAGGTIKRYAIDIGGGGSIGTGPNTTSQRLSDNGYHEFVEVTKDGNSVIFDNLHPDGINKVDYFNDVEGFIPGKGVVPSERIFEEGGDYLKIIDKK